MKKAKIVFWLIIFGFIALLVYQNSDFFMSKPDLKINLFIDAYHITKIPNAVLLLIFFFAGLLIAYFFSLFARFKAKKTIKSLNASLIMNEQMLEELKKEINILKGTTPSDSTPQTDTTESEEKDTHVS